MKTLYKITLFCALLFPASVVFAQQDEQLKKGIEFYHQGKNDEAIKILEKLSKEKNFQDAATALNYLGMAYLEKSDYKKARKALERAVEISPQNAAFRSNLAYAHLRNNKLNEAQEQATKAIELEPKIYTAYFIRGTASLREGKFDKALADADQSIALNADFSSAYSLKSTTLTAQFGNRVTNGSNAKSQIDLLKKALETLELCIKKCRKNADLKSQSDDVEALKTFYDYFSREDTVSTALTLSPDDKTVPLKIISKPRANYTDQARQANVSGKIVIAVLFAANGNVAQTIVIKPLGYGLDQQAVSAARGIRFEPLLKDGKAVSVVKVVEYSFTIY